MEDDPQSSDISNSGVQEVSNLRWKSMKNQIRVWNEAMRTSWLGLLIDPKSDPSVTIVVQQMTLLDQWRKVILKPSWGRLDAIEMWIDSHLLEMKAETNYGTKDDPVSSHIKDVLTMNPRPRLPTKVSFKGGSPPSIPNPSFFLASPNLGTRFL
jgi:hypothetical protein